MRSGRRFAGKILFGLVAVAALAGLVMLLWNAVVPTLFGGAHPIDYLHALGLLVLSRILFGGYWGRGGGCRGGGRWGRWQKMTPEEREQFLRSGGSLREEVR